MTEPEEVNLPITGKEAEEAKESGDPILPNQTTICKRGNFRWWFLVAMYSIFLLAGQSVEVLLVRLYFDKGGNSTWMATLVPPAGFIFLLPLYFISSKKAPHEDSTDAGGSPSILVLGLMYLLFGIFLVAVCILYTQGQKYLPVSTYSLLCASQLGFNALSSFFLNSQKFTPPIVNSLILLTISSSLLAFEGGQSAENPQGKFAVGFICAVAASALYALTLSLTQLAFKKVLKQETFKVVLDMIIYPSAVSACIIAMGLFASGEWKGLSREMQEYELGKVSYIMTLMWATISFQLFNIGCTGLIFQVSALFSDVISTLALPIVPVLAVFVFGDRMDGVKAIALVLAIWGSISYIYQHYLDDYKAYDRSAGANKRVSQALL